MIDYHMHLENGPLTMDYLQQFWQQAKRRGLSEIGVTEHTHKFSQFRCTFDHLFQPDVGYRYMKDWLSNDFQQDIEEYLALLHKARQGGVPVKVGIEVDYFPEQQSVIASLLDQYSFDFVLGSVHVIGQWGFDLSPEWGWEDHDVDTAYKLYYETLLKAAQSGLFDIMSHLDVIKVFGHRPSGPMDKYVIPVLEAIRDQGMAIEISTAGLRKPVGEMYPEERILGQARSYHIPITFSSDAHAPEDVGYRWEDAVLMAWRCGYREYRVFQDRKSWAEKLPKMG